MTVTHTQRGSAFFYILIAIVAFAALSYAIATSLRGNSSISDDRRKLIATEVIDAGSRLAEAVNRMRIRGIEKSAISFENSTMTGYAIGSCTTDVCRVFAYDGGGLSWETPPPEIISNWGYTGALDITDVGPTATAELVALLPGLSSDLCLEINVMLNVHARTVAVPSGFSFSNLTKYPGSFVTAATINNAILNRQKAGCFSATALSGTAIQGTPLANTYVYYQVLSTN